MAPPPPGSRRVLGVDPGTRQLGWGVVEARGRGFSSLGHGVIRANPGDDMPDRLASLAAGLREVIARLAPGEAAIEEAFHGRNVQAALRLGEGRGAALLVIAEAGLPVTGYANNVVKRSVTGGGRATKERVRAMVMRLLGLDEAPDTLDASDALALALCHHQRRGHPDAGAPAGPSRRFMEAVRRARRG